MPGLEFIGLVTRLLLSLIYEGDTGTVLKEYSNVARKYKGDYGLITRLALVTIFAPDAPRLINQIERHVLQAETHENGKPTHRIEDFKNSLTSNFAVTGVAGAVIAQVAMSALSLDDDDPSDSESWIVNGCYIVALISAILAVAVTCLVHSNLMGISSSKNIREWLSQPSEQGQDVHASAYSVMMLLAPGRLLSIAVSSLWIGFGILLGLLYTRGRGKSFGHFGALATLLTYICISISGLAIFFLPQGMKEIETRKKRKVREAVQIQDSGQTGSSSQQLTQDIESRLDSDPAGLETLSTASHRRGSDVTVEDQDAYSLESMPSSRRRKHSATIQLPQESHSERTFDIRSALLRPDVDSTRQTW